jgi:release factor glutamine methyltransferase
VITSNEILTVYKQHLLEHFPSSEVTAMMHWVKDYLAQLTDEELLNLLQPCELSADLPQLKIYHNLHRLILMEPVQYVFGTSYFHKYQFAVNSNTLIPRPETEELVELILQFNPMDNNLQRCSGLDIGTGTGCIPITLLLERQQWKFTALDVSAFALEVAKYNAQFHGTLERLTYILSDFLNTPIDFSEYQLIVSNPPYIPLSESHQLNQRVTKFEPHIALFTENDPLIFYKKILENALLTAKQGTQIWLETHQDYCSNVAKLFEQYGPTKKIEDLSGNPRFVFFIMD